MRGVNKSINKNDGRGRHVAVIGAGVSGLIAVRQLVKEGCKVTCLEKSAILGGIWQYQPLNDLADIRNTRQKPDSAIYHNLRTNFAWPCMIFPDFTEYPREKGHAQPRMYPSHETVQQYLENYARHFQLEKHIHYRCEVTNLQRLNTGEGEQWQLDWVSHSDKKPCQQLFDKVVICNGHYSKPTIPDIPGIKSFAGLVTHSLYYRKPELLAGKNVAVVGAGNSGEDISLDLSLHAKHVFFIVRSGSGPSLLSNRGGNPYGRKKNITQHPEIVRCQGRTLFLEDGSKLSDIDTVLFTTGFDYEYPFIGNMESLGLNLRDRYLSPLYMDTFCASCPDLAFVGLPSYTAIFWMAWFQAIWVARVFSGGKRLPSTSSMLRAVSWQERAWRDAGVKEKNLQRYKERQFGQLCKIAYLSGSRQPTAIAEAFVLSGLQQRRDYPGDYRDRPPPFVPTLEECGF